MRYYIAGSKLQIPHSLGDQELVSWTLTTFESNMSNNYELAKLLYVKKYCVVRQKQLCCATFAQHNIFSRTTIFPVRVVGLDMFDSKVVWHLWATIRTGLHIILSNLTKSHNLYICFGPIERYISETMQDRS